MPCSPTARLLALTLLGICTGVQAERALHSHAAIEDRVRQFLLQETADDTATPQVQVDRLDRRLRLDRCDRPLEAFLPPAGRRAGRVTVGVRCTGSKPWSLYVPARVALLAPVVVAKRDLERGGVIRAADLALERRDLARLPRGYLLQPQQAVGKTLERSVRRNRVLTPGLLKTPAAVRRGERVAILADIGGISVRMRGKALDRGGLGERIRVRNTHSGKELEARVVSAATVRVDI